MSRSVALIPIVLIALMAGCGDQNNQPAATPNGNAGSSAPAGQPETDTGGVPDAKGEKYFVGVTAVAPADRLADAARELLAAAEAAG